MHFFLLQLSSMVRAIFSYLPFQEVCCRSEAASGNACSRLDVHFMFVVTVTLFIRLPINIVWCL